ncbi:cation:proton antiporter [Chelativorans sp. SCAU2101]|jgi:Multisubunit Na+/H+ antiporter, MnhF subunit|uniref:Cation:proton antiporter n=1 Tax=Chelativorans petroleitrophicus TaxID=2975484 RepID=A0A9X3BAA4_9HYPH|nr:cation:proton antiporter [Chelativorans petroleitrophicus]MCT8991656.1 cation:proton antiporter [Chelativorans petroleitrophicus]
MTGEGFLAFAGVAALGILSLSLLLATIRVVLGPTLTDRVVGLDMLVMVAMGIMAVIGIRTGFTLYLDIAIALGLVGFLATVAFARFVMSRRYEAEFVSRDERGIYREKHND